MTCEGGGSQDKVLRIKYRGSKNLRVSKKAHGSEIQGY